MDLVQGVILTLGRGGEKEGSEQEEQQGKATGDGEPAGPRSDAGTTFAPRDGRHDPTSQCQESWHD